MKLLVDMNLSPLWIAFFDQNGYSATHWSSVGAASAPDTEITEYALAHRFVVFTHDLDFGRILAIGKSSGPSVLQIRIQDVLPSTVGMLVINALRVGRTALEAGALMTIDPVTHRIRLLPI